MIDDFEIVMLAFAIVGVVIIVNNILAVLVARLEPPCVRFLPRDFRLGLALSKDLGKKGGKKGSEA
jgi:hypothetical protein